MNVTVSTQASQWREALWLLYQDAFTSAVAQCAQEQLCYTEKSFSETLTDEKIIKFIVEVHGVPVGFALATFDLEKARVAYVNPHRLANAYPDHDGRILYFTCLVIHPEFQRNGGVFNALVRELTVFTDRHRAVVAFDFSTEKNGRLPQALVRAARQTQQAGLTATKEAQYRRLGGQEYGVIELT